MSHIPVAYPIPDLRPIPESVSPLPSLVFGQKRVSTHGTLQREVPDILKVRLERPRRLPSHPLEPRHGRVVGPRIVDSRILCGSSSPGTRSPVYKPRIPSTGVPNSCPPTSTQGIRVQLRTGRGPGFRSTPLRDPGQRNRKIALLLTAWSEWTTGDPGCLYYGQEYFPESFQFRRFV